jgi:hypothetical protein
MHPGEAVDPTPGGRPDLVADERFVHGLLQGLGEDAAARERRVAAVLAAIRSAPPAPRRRPRPVWRWAALCAAAACVVAAVLLTPTTPPAPAALVEAAVQAAQSAGDRRYALAGTWLAGEAAMEIHGAVEVRDAAHHVLRATVAGLPLRVGADGGVPWLDGDRDLVAHLRAHLRAIHLSPPERRTPETDFLLGSVDALLARLRGGHRLEALAPAPLPGAPGVAYHRVRARPLAADGGVDRVDLWLDPRSHLPQRVEIRWRVAGGRAPAAAPGPDHRLVLELAGSPRLPDDWFRPERHR